MFVCGSSVKLWPPAFQSRAALKSSSAQPSTWSLGLSSPSPVATSTSITTANMKLTTILLPALYCNFVASRATSSWFSANDDSQLRLQNDDPLSVPGENPLLFCADPKDNILAITKADLNPNPPKAYVSPYSKLFARSYFHPRHLPFPPCTTYSSRDCQLTDDC